MKNRFLVEKYDFFRKFWATYNRAAEKYWPKNAIKRPFFRVSGVDYNRAKGPAPPPIASLDFIQVYYFCLYKWAYIRLIKRTYINHITYLGLIITIFRDVGCFFYWKLGSFLRLNVLFIRNVTLIDSFGAFDTEILYILRVIWSSFGRFW